MMKLKLSAMTLLLLSVLNIQTADAQTSTSLTVPVWEDAENVECIVKTSDNVLSREDRRLWTEEMLAEERAGNAKRGYVVVCNPEGWQWGNLERDPKRYAIVKFPIEEYNESWLDPEYDSYGNLLTMRKYKLPLDTFMTQREIEDVEALEYNSPVDWSIEKNISLVAESIELVIWDARTPDLLLHGSSGVFTICVTNVSGECNYSSITAWEAAEDGDITGTGPCIANVTEAFIEPMVTVNGWTTTETDYIEVTVAAPARHSGNWSADAFRFVDTGMLGDIRVNNVIFDGVQIHATSSDGSGRCISLETGQPINTTIKNMICITAENGNGVYTNDPNVIAEVWNSVFYNNGTQGSSDEGIYCDVCTSIDVYNTLVTNYNDGFELDVGTLTVNNSIAFGNNDDFDSVTAVSFTASDDGDGDNPQSPADWNDIFVDNGSYDFHLQNNGNQLIDNGTTLTVFSDDFEGDTRPQGDAWDIGPDELVTAISDNPPTLILVNPPDSSYDTDGQVTFNCTSTDDIGLSNISGVINGTINWTNQTTGTWNQSGNTLNFSQGVDIVWNCFACDNASQCAFAPSNFTFRIDGVPPDIIFVSPTPNNETTIANYTFINLTLSEAGTCLLDWNGTNETMTGSGTNYFSNKTLLPNGNYTFFSWCNDSAGNLNVTNSRWVFINFTAVPPIPPVPVIIPIHSFILSKIINYEEIPFIGFVFKDLTLEIIILFMDRLTIAGNLDVGGNVNTSGNISGNGFYGEMWNYSANASIWNFDIDVANIYYNLTSLNNANSLNGFHHTDTIQTAGGSYMTAQVSGSYRASLSFSFEASQANALYGISIAKNFNALSSRECYVRRDGSINTAGNVAISCIISLSVGDIVNVQVENEDNNRDISVHTVNLNLVRVGD